MGSWERIGVCSRSTASNAQEKAHDKNNKTINAQHVFAAIKEMDIGVHNNELEGLLTEELEGESVGVQVTLLTLFSIQRNTDIEQS